MTLQEMKQGSMTIREKADFLNGKKIKLLEDYDWERYDDLSDDEKQTIENSIQDGSLKLDTSSELNIMVVIPAGSIVTLKTSVYKSWNTHKDAMDVFFILENGTFLDGGLDYLNAEFVEG